MKSYEIESKIYNLKKANKEIGAQMKIMKTVLLETKNKTAELLVNQLAEVFMVTKEKIDSLEQQLIIVEEEERLKEIEEARARYNLDDLLKRVIEAHETRESYREYVPLLKKHGEKVVSIVGKELVTFALTWKGDGSPWWCWCQSGHEHAKVAIINALMQAIGEVDQERFCWAFYEPHDCEWGYYPGCLDLCKIIRGMCEILEGSIIPKE